MSDEQFKLTEEMIKQIEEKVNEVMTDIRSGMKERLIQCGGYAEYTFVTACEIAIRIENEKVIVTDPIQSCDDEEEYDNDSDDPDLWE